MNKPSDTNPDKILLLYGLSVEILFSLSYRSHLGKTLKHNLNYFDKQELLADLQNAVDWIDEKDCLSDIALDYRVKSKESIGRKFDRYYPDHQVRKVFNDLLGFRAFCDDYNDALQITGDYFKVVDISSGKSNDDGYRGVHVYFQTDNYHYPIEIQFNTLYDRQFNNWLHEYIYKKNYPNQTGKDLRKLYEYGKIRNADEFKEAMKNVLSHS